MSKLYGGQRVKVINVSPSFPNVDETWMIGCEGIVIATGETCWSGSNTVITVVVKLKTHRRSGYPDKYFRFAPHNLAPILDPKEWADAKVKELTKFKPELVTM